MEEKFVMVNFVNILPSKHKFRSRYRVCTVLTRSLKRGVGQVQVIDKYGEQTFLT